LNKFQSSRLKARPGVAERPKSKLSLLSGPEKRRGVRLNSRVPIAVEWDVAGELHRGEAKTRIIGPYGCLVMLSQDLQIDQRVSVTNLVSSKGTPAVIVWRGHEGTEGWELGIELINPEMGFWGIDL
jgi:hypothetical protein